MSLFLCALLLLALGACEKETAPTTDSTTILPYPIKEVGTCKGSDGFFQARDSVYFAYDSSVLSNDAQKILDCQAKWLGGEGPGDGKEANITIEGHADERGTREYNLALGERRAQAAKDYLVASGVASERITTISYGKERPAVLGNDEAAWVQNRRAVSAVAQ